MLLMFLSFFSQCEARSFLAVFDIKNTKLWYLKCSHNTRRISFVSAQNRGSSGIMWITGINLSRRGELIPLLLTTNFILCQTEEFKYSRHLCSNINKRIFQYKSAYKHSLRNVKTKFFRFVISTRRFLRCYGGQGRRNNPLDYWLGTTLMRLWIIFHNSRKYVKIEIFQASAVYLNRSRTDRNSKPAEILNFYRLISSLSATPDCETW